VKGININCREVDYIELMFSGKVIETRGKNTLKSLVGQRVGLIRTGCGKATLEGYADIIGVVVYRTLEEFRADYGRHLVKPGSKYDFKGIKYGYVLNNVERCEPRKVTSRGIVIRNI